MTKLTNKKCPNCEGRLYLVMGDLFCPNEGKVFSLSKLKAKKEGE